MKTPPADVDDDPAADWVREDAATTIDSGAFVEAVEEAAAEFPMAPEAVPLPVDQKTPQVETTGRHRMTPHQFATAVDLADRDAYARGLEHGIARGRADAMADVVTELRRVREDGVEAFRSFFVIWNVAAPPTWEEAEAWYRSRLTPL